MKIKYTGLYEKIYVRKDALNFAQAMYRNVWYDIPQHVVDSMLISPHFYCEADLELKNMENKKVVFVRRSAMGDVLQLLPVLRLLKKKIPGIQINLATSPNYISILSEERDVFESVVDANKCRRTEYDCFIVLDGILENDHSLTNEEHEMHRIDIYLKFFGLEREKLDFGITYSDSDFNYARRLLCR